MLKLPVTLCEVHDQFAFQVLQFSDFAPNFGKLGAQQAFHLAAGMSTAVSQVEKLFDLMQRKSESLHLLDKGEPRNVVRCKEPELAHGPGCPRHERLAFIKPDRVYAQIGSLRRFADLECAFEPV